VTENTALTAFQEQLKQELANLTKTIDPPSSNKISTRGKVFTLPDGKSSPGPLNCVVLDWISLNVYYPGVFNPNQRTGPDCFAIGKVIEELRPSDNAPKKRSESDCASCPKGQWGTGFGGKGKACKNQRRLILVEPTFTERSQVMSLYVSPTGLKAWNEYVRRLATEQEALPVQVVTAISFDANQTYPTLNFHFVERHGQLDMAMRLRQLNQDLLHREPDVKAA
jgi:hypothetical protein